MPTLCAPTWTDAPSDSSRAALRAEREPVAAGPDGAELARLLEAALEGLRLPGEEQAEVTDGFDVDELEADDFEFEYRPMPPKRTFKMSVNIRMRGRGQPVAYDLDDDLDDDLD
jgi:hypothetical protein